MPDKSERKQLDDFGIKIVSGEIDDEVAEGVMEFILEANLNKDHPHLTLILNSPGGFVDSGMAIIDIMQGSMIPIHTVGIGAINSMGLTIFITGAKGCRTLTPNTTILSHQFGGWSAGKEHELIAAHKHNIQLGDMLVRHYRKHTGLTARKIRQLVLPASDVWLTAREALALGLCDKIKTY